MTAYPGHSLFGDQSGRNTALLQKSRGCRISYRVGSDYERLEHGVVIATNGSACYIQPENSTAAPQRIRYAQLFDIAVTTRPFKERLRQPSFFYPTFEQLEARAEEQAAALDRLRARDAETYLNNQGAITLHPTNHADGSITYSH